MPDSGSPSADAVLRPDPQLAQQVITALVQVCADTPGQEEHIRRLQRLLQVVLEHLASLEPLHFTTLFSLMGYMGHKYQIPHLTLRSMHLFRKHLEDLDDPDKPLKEEQALQTLSCGYHALDGLLQHVFQQPSHPTIIEQIAGLPPVTFHRPEAVQFEKLIVFFLMGIDLDKGIAIGYRPDLPNEEVQVMINIPDRNADFSLMFNILAQRGVFPLKLHLMDAEIDDQQRVYPRAFVLIPDHLVDVTTIADCFTPGGEYPVTGMLRRFLPSFQTMPILVGQIANYFLDRLIHDHEVSFHDAFAGVFALAPLAFAGLDDEEVRNLHTQCKLHFQHLKEVILHQFPKEGIHRTHCFLEPAFYSPEHGIQGRLDVLHLPPDRSSTPAIIELKSGTPFQENVYGLSSNHYIQTLLYDLLVRDTRPGKNCLTYILYSKAADRSLRYAPIVRSRQMDAVRVRNHLILWERELAAMDPSRPETWYMLDKIHPASYPGLYGFHKRDLETFARTWQALDALEKAWFVAFLAFGMREYHLSKTGRVGQRRFEGQAALWLANRTEKADNFSILSYLRIEDDRSHLPDPEIGLSFTTRTPQLSNFRVGDIVVLYPHTGHRGFTREQVWKCSIIGLTEYHVNLRLRSPQCNKEQFKRYPYWHIESDFMDSSFLHWTRGLFQFASAPVDTRSRLLGITAPGQVEAPDLHFSPLPNAEQREVISRLFASEHYFLLWGPPGTGKTSVVLREIVRIAHQQLGESLLLLAYTNRAVDEICEAVASLGESYKTAYLRIGSRYSTPPRFRDRLLEEATRRCANRQEVRQLVQDTRIFIGTISSFAGKPELLQQRGFDRVVIDEASQILEPTLCGMLTAFPHFTLIGDHCQLPAVVGLPTHERQIRLAGLNELGYVDAGTSLFERLFLRAKQKEWHHALGMLSAQGRMHEDIMRFPNTHFYEGQLTTIQPIQTALLAGPTIDHPLHDALAYRRVAFIAAPPATEGILTKTSLPEACIIRDLVRYFQQYYAAIDRTWHEHTLGIITPFRAQIALIRKTLQDSDLNMDMLTIDTVERYQGSARDIILISWSIHNRNELNMVTSGSQGVDRKLNVALTRAKERLISVGYPPAFEGNTLYRDYIQCYQVTEYPGACATAD
jgi:DNA replication ATP-dependent helicase Dna2